MTKDLLRDIQMSQDYEIELFFEMVKKLYDNCSLQSHELFDIALKVTDGFSNISLKAILQDSRIIKILRYSIIPVISQMKLGQLVGINTTADFEERRAEENNKQYLKLKEIGPKLVDIFNTHLDKNRFIWLESQLTGNEKALAEKYSQDWTCSLISNQNSSTAFRNWRKELQESTAVDQLLKAGYTSISKRKVISSIEDLLPGQFSKECRVKGINTQKADIVVRLKKSKKLLFIEAKAIGVKIDAFKRIKECREKFADWRDAFGRNGASYGAFLSGFIPASECQSILDEDGLIFWEHKKDLYEYANNN